MKYIIIGFAILYIVLPTLITIADLGYIYSFRHFLSEWWDTFKVIALITAIILGGLLAIAFIMRGIYSYMV